MRTEIHEMGEQNASIGSRRGRGAFLRRNAGEYSVGLEPQAVDAVFADETMGMHEESGSRRDDPHASSGQLGSAVSESATADEQLLRSLSAQLELLNQQQHEIRRLLDQAGRRRVDRVANE